MKLDVNVARGMRDGPEVYLFGLEVQTVLDVGSLSPEGAAQSILEWMKVVCAGPNFMAEKEAVSATVAQWGEAGSRNGDYVTFVLGIAKSYIHASHANSCSTMMKHPPRSRQMQNVP